jgi:molecular chaperone Hsp33
MDVSDDAKPRAENTRIEVTSDYVRERHALALFGSFSPLYVDYYLHLMQHEIKLEPEHDQLLKDALAGITLHLAARPQNELTAWTISLQDPLLNLFVTGDSEKGNVTGRVFTSGVKKAPQSLFFSQVTRPSSPIRQSTVEVTGLDAFRMVEQYYAQSEQLPASLFRLEDEQMAMIVAQPDIDMEWFKGLTLEAVKSLGEDETLSRLETRHYYFGCGCTLDLIYSALAPVARRGMDDLYQGEEALRIQCPRCSGVFVATREALQRYLAEHPE